MRCVDRIKEYLMTLRNKMKENEIANDRAVAERKEKLITLHKGENLPIVLDQIILQKNEICHCKCTAWYKTEIITTRHAKKHRGVSIKIAKGFSVNIGGSKAREIKKEAKYKYRGQLFITNKRIIFAGQKKNFTVIYPNIIAIKPYNYCFEFQTENISHGIIVNNFDFDNIDAILDGVFTNYVNE